MMAQHTVEDYPGRFALANELHARPFPELTAPCRAAHIAIKAEHNAAERDRSKDYAHLIALLDRFGGSHPPPEANHYSGKLGRGYLKWEQHTEFVTYTIFADGVADTPFDGAIRAMFPADWLAQAPGKLLTSCIVRAERMDAGADVSDFVKARFPQWFVPESLAVSKVIDGAATIASDFRIDENGHVRFAVLAASDTGSRRLGRIVQRCLEIETYKAAAMLTLPIAREVARKAAVFDRELSEMVTHMASNSGDEVETLDRLLKTSAEIELLSASTAFRFGAAGAYSAISNQRIEVLREERLASRQTFAEFMMRRFDPAMRTCRSAEQRMNELSTRAARASNLLRTRVDVASNAQNTDILASMNERAALQLRLQETVEGLSVVAISYYGVNLAANIMIPVVGSVGIGAGWVYAVLTPVIIALVFLAVRRIRKKISHS